MDLKPSPLPYRRSMVAGRQLFSYSRGYKIAGEPIYAERASRIYSDLLRRFWDDRYGGWFFSVGHDGSPYDARKDLYAQAFVMFGLAHYGAIFKDADAFSWASKTHELITTRLALPSGWFASGASRTWQFEDASLAQDPHMHLLEAYLSLYRASGQHDFLVASNNIMSIYDRFLNPSGKDFVLSYLDQAGNAKPDVGHIVEPGHLFEWYWLVSEYAETVGTDAYSDRAERTLKWATSFGVDGANGGIYDQVDTSGKIVSTRKRIWPVTECIKASVTRRRKGGDTRVPTELETWVEFLRKSYFHGCGLWHEYLNVTLDPDSDYLPASTVYHIAMAALEVDRLESGVGAIAL
ncbi:MAG: AGE family epimerase/isomerase [Proteobacteria bacterium]|nr:AGE family epimerase/isomerase [Pseudomonadota bacterium]